MKKEKNGFYNYLKLGDVLYNICKRKQKTQKFHDFYLLRSYMYKHNK